MGGQTNQVIHKCLGKKSKSYYLRVEGRTKSPTSALIKFEVFLPTGGRTNQATNKCLGTKFKSYHPRVDRRTKSPRSALVKILSLPTTGEGRTKPPISALVQNLNHTTYGWTDKPSHLEMPWLKFPVFLPTGGRTNQATHKCLGQNSKSSYLREDGRTSSPLSALVKKF